MTPCCTEVLLDNDTRDRKFFPSTHAAGQHDTSDTGNKWESTTGVSTLVKKQFVYALLYLETRICASQVFRNVILYITTKLIR